jgi:transposase
MINCLNTSFGLQKGAFKCIFGCYLLVFCWINNLLTWSDPVRDPFDLFSGSLFAFCNRKRNIVKILYWSKNGFCIWLKRLEEEKFRWPDSEEEVIEISQAALGWLLHGLDLRHAHRQLQYSSVG